MAGGNCRSAASMLEGARGKGPRLSVKKCALVVSIFPEQCLRYLHHCLSPFRFHSEILSQFKHDRCCMGTTELIRCEHESFLR